MSYFYNKNKTLAPEFKRNSRSSRPVAGAPTPSPKSWLQHRMLLGNLDRRIAPAAEVTTPKSHLFVACLVSHLQHAPRPGGGRPCR